MWKDLFKDSRRLGKILVALLLVFVTVFSVTFLASWSTDPEHHTRTIVSIDDKKDTAAVLSGTASLASIVLTTLPGDWATPIAEKLADLTEYFLIILTVLVAEKYLLTIFGAVVFYVLVPAACLLALLYLFRKKEWMKHLALKLLVFGLMIYLMIPASIRASDLIYRTYDASITATIQNAEQLTAEADEISKEDQSFWDVVSSSAENLKNKTGEMLQRIIEALAVMIVTTCLIPLVVLILFIWAMKAFWGVVIPIPKRLRPFRSEPLRPDSKEDPKKLPEVD